MINVRADLFGIEKTITRPIVIIVSNDIKKMLGIERDIYTTYDTRDSLIKKKNSIGDIQGDNTLKDDMVTIEHEEDSEDTKETSLIINNPDFFPIFLDKDTETTITPIYHSRQVVIKFKYYTKSESKAFALTNKLRLLTPNEGYYRRHRLEYHFTIPNYVNKLFKHIYTLKYNYIKDKVEYLEYLNNNMDMRVNIANTLDGDGDKSELVIQEAQVEVPGYILDDIYNLKPEYDDTLGYWTFEFNYGLIYEKPVTLLVKYPVMIYNQLIDKEFRTFIEEGLNNRDYINKPMTGRTKDAIELTRTENIFNLKDFHYYLPLPEFDNHMLPREELYLTRMFSVMCTVDPNDDTLLFNIQDIPKIKFKESVLKFIINCERTMIGEKLKSMFYIELYKNNKRDGGNKITLSEDGMLRSSKPLDMKYIYRVVFNVVNDLSLLHRLDKSRIKQFMYQMVEDTKDDIRPDSNVHAMHYEYDYYKSRRYNTQTDLVYMYLCLLDLYDDGIANISKDNLEYYNIPFKINTDFDNGFTRKTVATYQTVMLQAMMEER